MEPTNDSAAKTGGPAEVMVAVQVVSDGKTTETTCRFHTPTLLKKIKDTPDGCTVKMTLSSTEEAETRVLFEGKKEDAVASLAKSIVPAEMLGAELRKFAQFLLDHSEMRAIGIHTIFVDDDGKDGGFGFAATSSECTTAQGLALVNCGDANMDEFIARAKLTVPGRNGTGDIVQPTQDQIAKLG